MKSPVQMSKPPSMESPAHDSPFRDSLVRGICASQPKPISHVRLRAKEPAVFGESQPARQSTPEVNGLAHLCMRLPALTNRRVGEHIDFPGIVEIAGRSF